MDIKETLSNLRDRGITDRKLAWALDSTPTSIMRWRRGAAVPRSWALEALEALSRLVAGGKDPHALCNALAGSGSRLARSALLAKELRNITR